MKALGCYLARQGWKEEEKQKKEEEESTARFW